MQRHVLAVGARIVASMPHPWAMAAALGIPTKTGIPPLLAPSAG